MDQLLLIDKPTGMTSFHVIRILRRKLHIKKMGHSGTLDPRASGLLIIATGAKTKELSQLIGLPKIYRAQIQLGIKTDTGDLDGQIIEQEARKTNKLNKKNIELVLQSMIGENMLQVPAYSAIKKDGKKLYEYARSGKLETENIELPIKKMIIYAAKLFAFDEENNIIDIEFNVSSGSYIRSIAEHFAEKLGTIGTLSALRRISIGNFSVENASIL